MDRIKQIAHMIKTLEEQLLTCNRCGMCQAVCPLFHETGREADVARGKLALLCGLMDKMFADPKGVALRLDKCLMCGSCQANCPAGVDALGLFLKAKTIISRFEGLSPVKKAALRTLLSDPDTLDRLVELGMKFQKIALKPAGENRAVSCMRIGEGLVNGRHFTLPAEKPFHKMVPYMDTPKGKSGLKTAFFTGCLIDRFYPDVANDVLAVLDHHGMGVFLPEKQQCCGIPALSTGDHKTFEALMLGNLERFEKDGFDHLVTACATCTFTIKKIWPAFAKEMKGHVYDRILNLASKTMDINQLIGPLPGPMPEAEKNRRHLKKITYHDPCHLKKSLGVADEPRHLIRSNPDYALVEMAEPDACCGMGGSFNLKYYPISSTIGFKKRDQIKTTDCDMVATGCPACMLQITDMLSRSGDKIKVKHPIQIYAEMIKNRMDSGN